VLKHVAVAVYQEFAPAQAVQLTAFAQVTQLAVALHAVHAAEAKKYPLLQAKQFDAVVH
jgi:hypothetical protein